MKARHPKYKLKQSDSVADITKLFEIEESIWLRYHNNTCTLDDLIINNKIPKHLKEIYLLPGLWSKESELNTIKPQINPLFNGQKQIILYNKDILFFTPHNINNRYGVIMNFGKNKIHYEIEVKYLVSITPDVFQISIDRKQVYINNEEPNTKLYEISDIMAKAIYPITLEMDYQKKIHSIVNHDEILSRCLGTKDKISQYYVGRYAEIYIKLFEKHISNPNILINHLENELFYQLFFLPIQARYDTNLMSKTQYSHSSSTNKRTIYNLNVELQKNYTESGKIVANIESEETIDNKNCFEAQYRFYPEDHSIFSMRGNLIILDDKSKINNTYFEIYHINPESRVIKKNILNSRDSKILEQYNNKEPNSNKKKKSFWNFF